MLSPKLFTDALKHVFNTLEWIEPGISVDGEHISHLLNVDNKVVVAESVEQWDEILLSLKRASRRVGLRMNFDKIDKKKIC